MDRTQRNRLLRYSTVGLEFTATFVLMFGAGLLLDQWLGTRPGWSLVGGAIGFGVALRRLLRQGRRMDREARDESKRPADSDNAEAEDK